MNRLSITIFSRFFQSFQTVFFMWTGKDIFGLDILLNAYLFGLGISSFLGWLDLGAGSLIQLEITNQLARHKPSKKILTFYENFLYSRVKLILLLVLALTIFLGFALFNLTNIDEHYIYLAAFGLFGASWYMLSQQFVKQAIAYGNVSAIVTDLLLLFL